DRRPRHFGEQGAAGRARDGGRLCNRRCVFSDPPVLSGREARVYRRRDGGDTGRAAVLAYVGHTGSARLRDEQDWPRAEGIRSSTTAGAASRVPATVVVEAEYSAGGGDAACGRRRDGG